MDEETRPKVLLDLNQTPEEIYEKLKKALSETELKKIADLAGGEQGVRDMINFMYDLEKQSPAGLRELFRITGELSERFKKAEDQDKAGLFKALARLLFSQPAMYTMFKATDKEKIKLIYDQAKAEPRLNRDFLGLIGPGLEFKPWGMIEPLLDNLRREYKIPSLDELLEERQREKERINVKAEDALGEDIAPVPWDYWKNRGIIFPKKSTKKNSMTITTIEETGERAITSSLEVGNKIITHRGFIPGDIKTDELPKFGELTEKIYMASIYFQKAQIKKTNYVTWPHVTKADILKFLKRTDDEIKRGGRIFDLIDKAYWTLAFFTFEIKDKKTGQTEEIDHILGWKKDLEGRGFYFKLNDDHTSLIIKLLRGEKAGRYIGVPAWFLDSPEDYKRKIFEELLSLGGLTRPYPISIKTILKKWARFRVGEIKKMKSNGELTKYITKTLEEAKDKALIKGYEYTGMKNTNDPLEWKIKFSFYHKGKHFPIDQELLGAMLELWGKPLFEDKAQAERKRRQYTALMTKYGPRQIAKIFEETREAGENAFWLKVQDLKTPKV